MCGKPGASAPYRRIDPVTGRCAEGAILSFSGALRIFVAVDPMDLRKSFNGLEGVVREQLEEDPHSGALFVFTNRRHSRLNILY